MIALHEDGTPLSGELHGVQWQPRDLAAVLYAAGPLWTDALVLMEGVQVTLAESQGFDRAFNDNVSRIGDVATGTKVLNADTRELLDVVSKSAAAVVVFNSKGSSESLSPDLVVVTSRDVGLMQINIPAEAIGTATEATLYDAESNVFRGYGLYAARGWQPWAAWNSAVCFRDTYVKRAARGVGNYVGHYSLLQPTDAAAKPRYLADPVLDYEYRLGGALHTLAKVHADLVELKKHVSGANIDRVQAIVGDVAAGLAFKTADHPWDYES